MSSAGAAVIVQAREQTWTLLFPLPWGMDTVTAELIALTAAYHIAHQIIKKGRVVDYVTTDSELRSLHVHSTQRCVRH